MKMFYIFYQELCVISAWKKHLKIRRTNSYKSCNGTLLSAIPLKFSSACLSDKKFRFAASAINNLFEKFKQPSTSWMNIFILMRLRWNFVKNDKNESKDRKAKQIFSF